MNKILATLLISVLSFTLYASPVFAQYGEYSSPTPSQNILITKMVAIPGTGLNDPTQGNFVNNLSPSDPRFGPAQCIVFKVTIQSTSDISIYDVVITDFVPSYLTPIEGPGDFNTGNRTITYNVGDLGPMVKNEYFFKMKIADQKDLPNNSLFCELNKAQVTAEGGISDQSTSQFCIEHKVTTTPTPTPVSVKGVTTIPSTGPEFGLLLLGGNILAMTAGLYLKRKI